MGFGKGFGQGFGQGFGRGRGYGYGRGIGAGRGEFSGFSCVKFIFFGFNVIFWLLGCAILGIGIWLQVSKNAATSLSPSLNFFSATVLCITAGVLVLVVGFFGCCGAIMENKCLLMTYFVLVVVIFILEIVVGVLAFIYKSDIEKVLGVELLNGIRKNYPTDADPDTYNLRSGWKFIQTTFECCGVNNATDWFKSSGWQEKDQVPPECCRINTTDCQENADHWYKKACLPVMQNLLRQNLYIIGIVAISIGVIQILGLVASMAMFCCLRQDKYYDE